MFLKKIFKIQILKHLNFNNLIIFFKHILFFIFSFIFFFFSIKISTNYHSNFVNKQIKSNSSLLQNGQLYLKHYLHNATFSNIPVEFYQLPTKNKTVSLLPNVSYCKNIKLLSIWSIQHNNFYWQTIDNQIKNKKFKLHLLNAYYDNRIFKKPSVRILVASDQGSKIKKYSFSCFLWFDKTPFPVMSSISNIYISTESSGFLTQQIFTCDIPTEFGKQVPKAISLQFSSFPDCNSVKTIPQNILKIKNNNNKHQLKTKNSIGVCVIAFRFANIEFSARLIEWLEMVKLFGASQVYFYVHDISKTLLQVLKHYQKQRFVKYEYKTLPGELLNVKSMYNYVHENMKHKFYPQEWIDLNDCLLKNINRHEYVAVFDVDEMILPQKASTWQNLLSSIEKKYSFKKFQQIATFKNLNVFVHPKNEMNKISDTKSIPWYMYMSKHVIGDAPIQHEIKSIHRTSKVYSIRSHQSKECLSSTSFGACLAHVIKPELSLLMHYRNKRFWKCNSKCNMTYYSVWKYYDTLRLNVKDKLKQIL